MSDQFKEVGKAIDALASNGFTIKDSGRRMDYASGMRRDVTDDKTDYLLLRDGPMFRRLAEHLTKGAQKYGKRNWQLANSDEEYQRFRESAARHFEQWLAGDRDEDHAAAVMFNVNAAEYVRERLADAEAADSAAEQRCCDCNLCRAGIPVDGVAWGDA